MAGKSITRKQMVDKDIKVELLRNILENHLIAFVNIVNECCEVFEGEYEDYIGEWFFTATSVVPPPISTIIVPIGSVTGKDAPIAAATGSSIK